jgi:hypothetical protein
MREDFGKNPLVEAGIFGNGFPEGEERVITDLQACERFNNMIALIISDKSDVLTVWKACMLDNIIPGIYRCSEDVKSPNGLPKHKSPSTSKVR